ncbi:MAG: phytanoyl-CoA dioxygenase family protein [Planctomycetaceae bacterium]|nr:phytanoyl-CoA dioxygenase family protein [Planctomycetaceae bacterium]
MNAYKQQYDSDGFVVIREFLPPDEFASLRSELDRYIRNVVPALPNGDAFYQDRARPETLKQLQHMGRDAYFAEYRKHPRWQALAEELIGEPSAAKEPEWFNKPPGTEHPTPPHQDNFYFCLRPANVLTMWLALDHVDAENGCLRYVSGSHHRGIRPHLRTGVLGFSQGIHDFGANDYEQEVEIHLAPGDLVIHHGETIHRAEPNRSATRHRRAFAMVFQGESCRRDENAFARYEASLHSQHSEMGLATA